MLIQKDDRIAFYNLYERYCRRLYGFVLRYIKQKEDAEEIVQEVFVKIWESRNKTDAFASKVMTPLSERSGRHILSIVS